VPSDYEGACPCGCDDCPNECPDADECDACLGGDYEGGEDGEICGCAFMYGS